MTDRRQQYPRLRLFVTFSMWDDRDLSNLGRGIDELKKRVDRIEDSP